MRGLRQRPPRVTGGRHRGLELERIEAARCVREHKIYRRLVPLPAKPVDLPGREHQLPRHQKATPPTHRGAFPHETGSQHILLLVLVHALTPKSTNASSNLRANHGSSTPRLHSRTSSVSRAAAI